MACLRLNGYTLDLDQAQLLDLHGQAVELRPQALAVLLELGRRHGELVTKLDLSAQSLAGRFGDRQLACAMRGRDPARTR